MIEGTVVNAITIPCEFCYSSITFDQYNSHSNVCPNRNRIELEKAFERSLLESNNETFQCEFCFRQIDVQIRDFHLNKCFHDQFEQFEQLRKKSREMTNDQIPCEYCRQSFPFETIEEHQINCQRQHGVTYSSSGFPDHWDLSSNQNLTRHVLSKQSNEFQSIASYFHQTVPLRKILQVERIQNRRWFRQFDAHRDGFVERYGRSTEQWLFHGCSASSAEAIIQDCFNRSHTQRFLVGHGIYFAADARTSFDYAQPDEKNVRRMFLARVLVGRTTSGDSSTRVCPSGFDTTGNQTIKVTYHDAQAYGEYLITFQ